MPDHRTARVARPHPGSASTLSELGIRPALILGFALTIGIWVLAYYYFSERIQTLELRQSELSARYETAQDLLTAVRTGVMASSVAARNALIEDDPDDVADHIRRSDSAKASVASALSQYASMFRGEASLDTPVQRSQVAQLQREVSDFDRRIAALLSGDRHLWPANARGLFNQEVAPARESTMNVAESLLRLNRAGFIAEQAVIAGRYKSAQQGILGALGFALLASLGVAIVLSRYAGGLESRVREQRAHDLDNAVNLERLTARLVTAHEEERRHVARELHDEVGQVLTVVKFAIADAQQALADAGRPMDTLEDAREVTDTALRSIRGLSRQLHPSLLDDMGVAVAIDAHLQGFRKHYGVEVIAEYETVEDRMAPEIELALYRTVQEAMTNIARHAHATTCTVRLRRTGDCVDLTIEDNGVGFDAVAACRPGPNRGLGLLGMQERVKQFNGEILFESAPGQGTRLFASFPVTLVTNDDTDDAKRSSPEGLHA